MLRVPGLPFERGNIMNRNEIEYEIISQRVGSGRAVYPPDVSVLVFKYYAIKKRQGGLRRDKAEARASIPETTMKKLGWKVGMRIILARANGNYYLIPNENGIAITTSGKSNVRRYISFRTLELETTPLLYSAKEVDRIVFYGSGDAQKGVVVFNPATTI